MSQHPVVPHCQVPAKFLGLADAAADACEVGDGRAGFVFEALGFEAGQAGEFGLDVGDLVSHGCGFEAGFVGGQFGLLGRVQYAGGEQSLVGSGRGVIEAFAASDLVGGPAGGFLGWGEVVQSVTDQGPQLVE